MRGGKRRRGRAGGVEGRAEGEGKVGKGPGDYNKLFTVYSV